MAGNAVEKSEERRNYRRVSDAVALSIEILGGQPAANEADISPVELPNHPTHVVSLSPNGLKFYHTESLEQGVKVNLRLRLFPQLASLEAQATVVNSGEEKGSGKKDRFFAGLAFSSLSDENRNIILDHLDQVARQSFGGAVKLVNT